MKRIQYIFIMALMLTLGMGQSWATDITGSGTSSSPYMIYSATGWSVFRTAVNSRSNASTPVYAELMNDITIPSGDYTPVGTSSKYFYGNFDGNGHTITFSGATSSNDNFGLFGYALATIHDLTVAGTMTVSGTHSHIGGIVAYLKGSSTIKGCSFVGTLDAGSSTNCIGGIVGFAESSFNGTIQYCFSNGTLKTTSGDGRYIGGILGYFNDEDGKKPTIQYNFSDCQFKNGSSNMTSGTYTNGIIGRIRAHADNIKYNTCIAHGNVSRACQSGNTDATIDASNKAITISVTAGANGSVDTSYVKPTSDHSTKLQVTATPAAHYHFSSWTDGGAQTHQIVLTSSVSVSATFAIDRHTITLAKYNNYDYRCRLYVNGTESTGGTYDYGTQLTLKCVPDTYCYFVDWKKGSTTVSENAEFSYTVTENATLTARCNKTIYTLTLQTNDANRGTVSGSSTSWGSNPAQGLCDAYTDVSLTATANTGYHFVNWTKNGQEVSTSASCSYRAHGNETLVANFAPNPYTLTLGHTEGQTDSWGTISASGAGVTLNQNGTYTVPYTTTVTLTATAASNHYKFKQWSDGSTDATRTYTMPAENTSITAEFEYVFTIANGTLTACKDWASGAYTIPSGVTAIGQQAFANRTGITSINIPASVTSIGIQAFWNCSGLSTVTFAANSQLTTIGDDAFAHRYGHSACPLTSIVIPASVTTIESRAFYECTSLSSVTFEATSQLTTISSQAFQGCHIAAITIPASVTTINSQAFYFCSSLQDVTFLSNTPPSIYVSNNFTPFTSCHSNLKIHLTCQQIANYTNTSTYANATNWTDTRLTSRFAPDMSHLSSVQYAVASGQSDMGSVSVGQNLTNCSDPYLTASPSAHYHFVKWSTADNDNFSTSATLTVGEVAANTTYTAHFAIDTYTLTVGHTEGQSDSWGTISVSGTGITNNQDGTWTVPYGTQVTLTATTADNHYYRFNKWSDGNSSSSHYYTMPAQDVNLTGEFHYAFVIEDGTGANGVATHTITGIRDWASGAYEIPDTVTAIGDSAFIGRSNITAITFAQGSQLATIGVRAFKSCSNLSSISLPSSLTSIGNYAFHFCRSLNEITIPASVTSIGEGAFYVCSGLSTVTFAPRTADQTLTLGSYAFFRCALTSVTIPASVTSIGSGAFDQCSSLGSITFAEGIQLTSIGAVAFNGCGTTDGHHLTAITIPASVTSIGNRAFMNCTYLENVTLQPTTPPSIGDEDFAGCSNGLQLHLNCNQQANYTNTTYPNASGWSSYSTLFAPDMSHLSRVQSAVADGCSGMGSVTTNSSVSSCSDIYLTATANDHYHFVKWSTANYSNYSTSATLTASQVAANTTYTAHFAIDTYTLTVGHATGQTDSWGTFSVSGTGITDNHNGTWTVPYGTEVTLTATTPTTNSNYYHFTQWSDGNTQTSRTITMPANNVSITAEFEYVFVISNGTLTACKSWASGAYTIPAGVTTIGNSAFESRGNITALTIPASVSSIEAYAFWNCSGLSTVTFAANSQLTTIGDFAFAHSYDHSVCPLSEIVIPALVTTIGNSAFYDCRYLSSVTFEANSHLTTISAQAFWSCSFGSITIPTSVTTIESQAFSYCSSLQDVYLQPTTPPSIYTNTFGNCHRELKFHLSCQQIANYTNTTTYANASNWSSYSTRFAPDLSHLSSVQHAVANGCSGMGSVSTSENVTSCDAAYLTAVPATNYRFVKWSTADNDNFSTSTTLTAGEVTGGATYTAHFELDTYTLTVAHVDGQTNSWGTFSVSGTGVTPNQDGTYTVINGSQVSLSATPTSNYYHFTQWSDGSTDATRTYTMPAANTNLTAEFEYVFTLVDGTDENSNATRTLTECKSWASGEYEIPSGVTAIGNSAFESRGNITALTIPASVSSIEAFAFWNCSGLSTVTFAANSQLTTIGNYAFAHSNGHRACPLTSIVIPATVATIGQGAFYDCTSLSSVTFEATSQLTTISAQAFWSCSFGSITIPTSVNTIESQAFCYCSSLQHVYMLPATPPSLTVDEEDTPFSDCHSNLQIHLSCPQVANYTNNTTYANATNWTDNRISGLFHTDLSYLSSVRGNTWSDESEWGTVTTNNNVTSCSDTYLTATANEHYHFVKWSTASNSNVSSNTTLTAGEVTANTTYMANFAPDNYILDVAHVDGQTNSWGTFSVSGSGITDNHDGTWFVPYGAEVTLTAVAASNYYHFTQWSDGNGNSPSDQNSYSFTMPAHNVRLTAEFEYVFTIVEDYDNQTRTLTACKSWAEGDYEIPYGVTAIGNNAFYGRENITSINITATVTSIGSEAFRACNRLSTISFADDSQLRSIGTSAFMYCGTIYPLTSVTIPESVTSIGSAAFDECSNLKHVYMQPTTPPSINTNTFGNCHSELKFHLPCQQMANYTNTATYPNASNWSSYSNRFTPDLRHLNNWDIVHLEDFIVIHGVEGLGTVNSNYIFTENCDSYFCTAEAVDGYHFENWTDAHGDEVSTNATLYVRDVTPDGIPYTPHFAINTHTLTVAHAAGQTDSWGTLTVSGNGVTDNNDGTYTVPYRTRVTLTTTTSNYYHLKQWSRSRDYVNVVEDVEDDEGHASLEFYMPDEDMSFTAEFEYVFTIVNGENNTRTLTECKDWASGAYEIPASVTAIGNQAFRDRISITAITIPASVTSIGSYAFYDCTHLGTITFSDDSQLTTIGESAFRGCSPSSITIPGSVTSIGNGAFGGCTNLGSITFNNGSLPLSIGEDAFGECGLSEGHHLTAVTIPARVTAIGNKAFYYCYYINSINFEETSHLISIGELAFYQCGSQGNQHLTSIAIPASVTSIGVSAFEGCCSLGSITFGENSQLTSIGNRAFIYCGISDDHPLTSVTIPASVTSIGNEAFRQCSKLSNITFAEGSQLATIGEKAFYSCGKLTSITIPASVTSIGEGAFNVCNSLGSITFGANSHLTTIGKRAFSNCGISDDHPYLTAINIPATVTSIGSDAFRADHYLSTITFGENSQLTSIGARAFYQCGVSGGHLLTAITIPASVTSIGDSAFRLCDYLQDVTLQPATPPALGRYAFQRCHSDLRFHVSCAQYSNYSTADNWSNLNFTTDRFPNGASVQVAPGCSLKGTVSVDCATATATATANTSFTFTGWYVEGSETPVSTNATLSASQMTANTTYYASFVGESHTLTVVVNNAPQSANWGGIRGGSSSFVVRHGDVARIAIEFNENGTLNGADYNFKKYYNVKTYQRSDMGGTTTPDYTDPNYEYQFTMPDQDVTVTVELEYVFTIENSVLTACKVWASGDLVIPDGVVAIGENAFNNHNISSITIPASVTSIEDYAFIFCTRLERVNLLPAMPPSLGSDVFDYCSDNIHFYIPCTNRGYYNNEWSNYLIEISNSDGSGDAEFLIMVRVLPFVEVQGSVASACQGMGTVSVNYQISNCWDIVLSATANTGYHFLFWNDGNTDADRSADDTPATGTLTAYFEPDNFYLYAHVADEQQTMGHVSGSGTYAFGTEAILTAEAYEGYAFERWSDGSTLNPRTVTIGLENDYTAFFREAAGTTASDIRIVSQGSSLVIYGGEGQQLRLYDMQGRLLSLQTIASTPFEMHDLATGVYMVQVGDQPAQKVVIMK